MNALDDTHETTTTTTNQVAADTNPSVATVVGSAATTMKGHEPCDDDDDDDDDDAVVESMVQVVLAKPLPQQRQQGQPLRIVRSTVVAALLFLLAVTAVTWEGIWNRANNRTLSTFRQLFTTSARALQEEEEEEYVLVQVVDNGKWHPDKTDVNCQQYWQHYNTTGSSSSGVDSGEYVPCRPAAPVTPATTVTGTTTAAVATTAASIPINMVMINISVAIEPQYIIGIPKRLTSVVKKYFNETNVVLAFLQEEYDDGRHFELQVANLDTSPVPATPVTTTSTTGNTNNIHQRQLRRQLRQRQPRRRQQEYIVQTLSLTGIAPQSGHFVEYTWDTPFAWYYHVIYLLVNQVIVVPSYNTSSTTTKLEEPVQDLQLMAWLQLELQAMVYSDILLQGPMGPYYDTNHNVYYQHYNNDTRQVSYLEWSLQQEGLAIGGVAIPGQEPTLLNLTDPSFGYGMGGGTADLVGPAESVGADAPIAGSSIVSSGPADEMFSTTIETVSPTDPSQHQKEIATLAPTTDASLNGTLSGSVDHNATTERMYQQPLSTSFESQQWWGLAGLCSVIVFSLTLVLIANELAKRREQEELWGNLDIFETATENVQYLQVGWRFTTATTTTDQDAQQQQQQQQPDNNIHASLTTLPYDNNTNINQQQQKGKINTNIASNFMVMQVFDKKGMGYREDDSLLMGGYEYKSSTAIIDAEVPSIPPPPSQPFRVEPFATTTSTPTRRTRT